MASDCRGVTMLEYAIMGSIIAAALVIGVPPLAQIVSDSFTGMANHLLTHT